VLPMAGLPDLLSAASGTAADQCRRVPLALQSGFVCCGWKPRTRIHKSYLNKREHWTSSPKREPST